MTIPDHNAGSIPEWDMGDRLRKSLRSAGMTNAQMAEYLGVARETISTWLSLRHPPAKTNVMMWALRTGVPYEWIVTGSMSPLNGPNPDGGKYTPRDLNPEPTVSGFRPVAFLPLGRAA